MIKRTINKNKGFTLVEIMVAIGLFTIVSFIALGAILTVFDANRRAQSSKTIVDNLNYSIESMARTIRFGNNYHCGTGAPLTVPLNCTNNDPDNPPGSSSMAVTFNGNVVVYRQNGTKIQRSDNGGATYVDVTPPEAIIQQLRFYVFGTTVGDIVQPYVVAVISGYVGSKPTIKSSFFITTTMSQRSLDI